MKGYPQPLLPYSSLLIFIGHMYKIKTNLKVIVPSATYITSVISLPLTIKLLYHRSTSMPLLEAMIPSLVIQVIAGRGKRDVDKTM